jgi:Ca2+-binding RTX toxin-like protein
VARKLQVRIITGSTAGTLTLVGVDQNGNAATQAIDIAVGAGTRTVVTDKAYATLTSATISGGSGFAGSVSIGLGTALGVPTNKSPAATAFAVYKEQVNGLDETVGTVDATAMTIAPTTPADGAHSFAFWYNFTVTPTSPAHNHTLA